MGIIKSFGWGWIEEWGEVAFGVEFASSYVAVYFWCWCLLIPRKADGPD